MVCGLTVVVVGDSVVYYPAASTGSIVIFYRAGIKAHEVFRLGLIMTAIAIAVVFLVLPYWRLVGEPLAR